jgi:hypothetical protein
MGLDLSDVRKLVGKESGDVPALDKVSKSDIRHWLEMMGEDRTPCHEIDWKNTPAPPAMLLAWTMPPYWTPEPREPEPHEIALQALDEAGYDGSTGLELDQEILLPVYVGDRLSYRVKLEGVSGEEVEAKMGTGIQVDLTYTLSNQNGETVSRQRCRLLKFKKLNLAD